MKRFSLISFCLGAAAAAAAFAAPAFVTPASAFTVSLP
jgi:hypothetical protein